MSAENTEVDSHRKPQDPAAMHANGSPHSKSGEFARHAKAAFSQWPSSLDAQLKRRPYATAGMALAIGVGAGVLLGSRILRSVLASAASYAVIELGRTYWRQTMTGAWAGEK